MFGKKAAQTTLVRTYKNPKEFQKDANKLAKEGWKVQSQTEDHYGKGLIAAALTAHITVTYTRG